MPHIKSSDRALASAIERWMETARDTVDDIGAWRHHLSERTYHPISRLDEGFGPLTAFLIGHIQAETHLDPSAIQSVHATLTLWDAAPDSDDLPPQQDIVRDLERSLVVVTAIRESIINATTAQLGGPAKGIIMSKSLTKKQLLARGQANDDSPDWRDWSGEKCDRERHNIPELDAWMNETLAQLKGSLDFHAGRMRAVDPRYMPSDKVGTATVYAVLAHKFNMRPDEVSHVPLSELYGLIRASELINGEQKSPHNGPTIDTTTAAARLEVPERSVRRWCADKTKPCHNARKQGGKWVIPESDIPHE